jgi:hypothetical protein
LTGTFRNASALPEVGRGSIEVVRQLLIQAAFFRVGFDRTPERHAALIFLLTAGLGGAVLE